MTGISSRRTSRGGEEIAVSLCDVTGNWSPTNNTQQDVVQTGGALWQVQVPANSGGIDLLIEGLIVSATTGTNVATTSQRFSVYIVDEANAQVGLWQQVYYGTGTSQTPTFNANFGAPVDNNAADKTYRVQVQVTKQGVNSGAGALNSGGIFPKAALKAVRR
jgi:hypothetical protein